MKRKDHRLWADGVFVAMVTGESIKTGNFKIVLGQIPSVHCHVAFIGPSQIS